MMLTTILVLLALGGVTAKCLYTPDANGHAVVPDGVTSIGEQAFYKCVSLISIALPEGLTSIGRSAFQGATSLASVSFPEGLTSIGTNAFKGRHLPGLRRPWRRHLHGLRAIRLRRWR